MANPSTNLHEHRSNTYLATDRSTDSDVMLILSINCSSKTSEYKSCTDKYFNSTCTNVACMLVFTSPNHVSYILLYLSIVPHCNWNSVCQKFDNLHYSKEYPSAQTVFQTASNLKQFFAFQEPSYWWVKPVWNVELHMYRTSHVPNFTCTKLHMYQTSHVPNFTCTKLHMYRTSHVPNSMQISLKWLWNEN